VVIADPGFAPMYATRSRKVKTDRRDARCLAEACQLGAYRAAHRTSDASRHLRDLVLTRKLQVRMRSQTIVTLRSLLRREGFRLRSGAVSSFRTLHATMDDTSRFSSARAVRAYLGLVPSERSSGEKRQLGHITKRGQSELRSLLVEAAWRIVRSTSDDTLAMRNWAAGIAARRGRAIAVVATWRMRPPQWGQARTSRPKLWRMSSAQAVLRGLVGLAGRARLRGITPGRW
jgi:transposase